MTVHSPILFAIGAGAFLLGVMLWRWAGRNSINLKGAAISSALAAAKSGKIPTLPDQFKSHVDALSAKTSNVGRAKVVGGSVARHFMAKVATMASLASLLGGAAMIALSLLWK